MKKTFLKDKIYCSWQREKVYRNYELRYYNLFMAQNEIDGLDYQQNDFVFRKFWSRGRIAGWLIKNTGLIGVADFEPVTFNYLDFPLQVQLINNRGASFIPTKPLAVDKDVVIGWAQHNKRPICEFVQLYISRITDVEMIIRTNLKAQKNPLIFATTSGNDEKMKELENAIDTDEPMLYFEFADGEEKPTALVSGAPYNIDKLYAYKQSLENELLTILGVNNLGNMEKRERLISAEVESNNEVVDNYGNNMLRCIESWCERMNATFGTNLKLKKKETPQEEIASNEEDNEEDNKDVDIGGEDKDNENE